MSFLGCGLDLALGLLVSMHSQMKLEIVSMRKGQTALLTHVRCVLSLMDLPVVVHQSLGGKDPAADFARKSLFGIDQGTLPLESVEL